jgi:hypothetical protein
MPSDDRRPISHGTNDSAAPPARTTRRRISTARFIERFEALTGFHVGSDSTQALPKEFLARPVPSPEILLREHGQEFELRTRNALCRFEPGRPHEGWTFARLLDIRGFGVFSLLDLLEVLSKRPPPKWAPADVNQD